MNRWSLRGLIFSALFAGVMIALSSMKVSLPFSTVPITLQTLAVMLAGSVLGARYGTIAVLIVIGLAAAGFPVLAGRGGLSVLVGPTAGYIFAWPVSAFLIGWFAQRMSKGKFTVGKLLLVNFLFGSLLVYPSGVAWLVHSIPSLDTLPKALTAGMLPFLPGDFLKAALCASVVTAVWKVYPIERIVGRSSGAWLGKNAYEEKA
ncbi:biotin transporter BioY [Paenibacillus sp. 7124]|uniref:Biotin transporter n=1 Tax=Paenibacillus apii TaxID=1850370 RepID=A0A6M1PG46_9BACL|nr:biotin transporter BioY [Paenibacillus apii]NGM82156.1 biotin transporter BioY [Paenibacillus apii]